MPMNLWSLVPLLPPAKEFFIDLLVHPGYQYGAGWLRNIHAPNFTKG